MAAEAPLTVFAVITFVAVLKIEGVPPTASKLSVPVIVKAVLSSITPEAELLFMIRLFMEEIVEVGGYFNAVEQGFFVDSAEYPERNGDGIARKIDGGVGYGYIYERDEDYMAPVTAHFGYNNVAQQPAQQPQGYANLQQPNPNQDPAPYDDNYNPNDGFIPNEDIPMDLPY